MCQQCMRDRHDFHTTVFYSNILWTYTTPVHIHTLSGDRDFMLNLGKQATILNKPPRERHRGVFRRVRSQERCRRAHRYRSVLWESGLLVLSLSVLLLLLSLLLLLLLDIRSMATFRWGKSISVRLLLNLCQLQSRKFDTEINNHWVVCISGYSNFNIKESAKDSAVHVQPSNTF